MIGGSKGTVHVLPLTLINAAFTAEAAAWPPAQASGDGRCRPSRRFGGGRKAIMMKLIVMQQIAQKQARLRVKPFKLFFSHTDQIV